MADLPKSIRVGYRDYSVESWPKPDLDHAGSCDNNWAEIKIDEEYGPQRTAELLMHELLHAAYHSGNLTPADDEERLVTVLAIQLTQVWRDNPDWVEFMTASLSE